MNNPEKIRRKIAAGKFFAAGFLMLDDRLDKCFLQFLEPSSIEIFKKLILSVQAFYNLEFPNLSSCLDKCSKMHGKCSPTSRHCDDLQKTIKQHCDVKVNLNHDLVLNFRKYILN